MDSRIVLADLHDLQFVVGVTEHVVFGLHLKPIEYALHDALIGLDVLLGQLFYEAVGFLGLCVEHLHLLRTELRDGAALLGCLLLRQEYALELMNPLFRLDEFRKDLAHLFRGREHQVEVLHGLRGHLGLGLLLELKRLLIHLLLKVVFVVHIQRLLLQQAGTLLILRIQEFVLGLVHLHRRLLLFLKLLLFLILLLLLGLFLFMVILRL